MKRISSLLLLGLALVLSCTKEGPAGVNKIDGLYTIPQGAIEMGQLTGAVSTWSTDRRYFDLSFGGSNATVVTTLVGYDALLASGQYLLGADEIGKAVLAETKVNGKAVKEGFFSVNERDGKYTITAQLDGVLYAWKGSLPFEPDPDPVELSVVLSAQANNGVLTMNLATPGIESGYNDQWQVVWTGEGGYLALDINTGSNYLADGNYVASAVGGVVNPGEFGIGWDPGDLYGVGMIFTDWGTCWWDVEGGTATATKIVDGLVSVTSREEKVDDKDVVIWTISWGVDYPKEIVFEGAIPALTKPKKPAGPVEPDYFYTETITASGDGVENHAFDITDKNEKLRAHIELLMAAGETNYEGSYPSTSYSSQPGQMVDGWEIPDWGMGGGSYWMDDNDNKVLLAAGQYTMIVTKIAEGAYNFTCEVFDYNCAGPDYVPGEGGDDDVTGDVVLKLTSGLTYTMEDVTASNTDSSQNPLSGMTLWRVVVSNSDGEVAEFDLGTAEGSTDLAGEYTVMAYPDAVGKAGNGWGWIPYMKGGCYFLIDENYYWIPTGNTITVSNNSDGTIKIKMEGPVQNADNTDAGQGGLLLNNIAKS